jgi:hypothetical protein
MAPYNLGMSLVHEAGHWLGLLHTFEGGCDAGGSGGDGVADTPAEAGPAFGCPKRSRNSCPRLPGNDLSSNVMSYVDDACMRGVTKGQAARMQAMWAAYRAGSGGGSGAARVL